MTQSVLTREISSNEDVKVTLKRKNSETKEATKKIKKTINDIRSKINADKDIWDNVAILNQDCRTPGVIPRLEPNFKKGETLSAYLCSPLTDHLATGLMDLGWGCGYRNCQMLMTFLERQLQDGEPLIKQVLDIHGIQLLLEKAWQEGFDTLGATQLDHHLFNTRKWIGTTEVYTLLAYLGIRSTIIDFHHPGPKRLHQDLMNWIQSYFMESTTKYQENHKTVYITNRPPLYLQHQGHSRTVVGIEILKSGKRNLIMFDPGRRTLRSYKQQNYAEEDTEDEEDIDILNDEKKKNNDQLPSTLLRPFRVDDKSIGKHKQYQILVLGHVKYQNGKMMWDSDKGYLLNEDERESMKTVTSLTVI